MSQAFLSGMRASAGMGGSYARPTVMRSNDQNMANTGNPNMVNNQPSWQDRVMNQNNTAALLARSPGAIKYIQPQTSNTNGTFSRGIISPAAQAAQANNFYGQVQQQSMPTMPQLPMNNMWGNFAGSTGSQNVMPMLANLQGNVPGAVAQGMAPAVSNQPRGAAGGPYVSQGRFGYIRPMAQ